MSLTVGELLEELSDRDPTMEVRAADEPGEGAEGFDLAVVGVSVQFGKVILECEDA
jgi:hypothetical protein